MTRHACTWGAVLLAALGAQPGAAQAQNNETKVITAEDAKAPSTPAVSILETSPTTIERPDTPRALVFNLISSVADAKGIPTGYAVQVAPYWLKSHPELQFDSYVSPTVAQSISRSFAISVATADWTKGSGEDAVDLGSRLALGVNSVILPGHIDPKFVALRDEIIKLDQELLLVLHAKERRLAALEPGRTKLQEQLRSETSPEKLVEIWRQLDALTSTMNAIAEDLDDKIGALEDTIKEKTRQMQQLNVQRYGARLSLAAAWSTAIPNDILADAHAERTGVWLTSSYRMRMSGSESSDAGPVRVRSLDALGVIRYLRDRTEGSNAWDAGGRLVFEVSPAVAVSGEALYRWRSASSSSDDSYRAVGMFEVRLADKAYLFASFGRDFTDAEKERTLVSIIGLNLGFGEKPTIAIDK